MWLVDKGVNALGIYYWLRKLTTSKQWSRSISQYNLIRVCTANKPLKCLEWVGIDEMMRHMHVIRKDLNGGLQELIFEHLRKKAEKMKENYILLDKKMRSKIIGQRGDGVLERERVLGNFKWCTTEVEFSRSIVVWHLATEICYYVDKEDASNYVSTSKCLSEYMMYLLVIRPNMLSKGFIDEGYLNTLGGQRYADIIQSYREAPGYDTPRFQTSWKTDKSAVFGGHVLAKQLMESISKSKKRWEMIEEVWMEMLTYAAAHCPWKEHANQLRRGGELLTHVCFLMLHLGLSSQYEYRTFEDKRFSATNKR
ncbi:hypothetical protein OIU79_025811 [Salix purpurea]|uniref:DUF4220 domain-containing protein n=1 Tax=Salix purpurea TaxID=77065 RepID=A0A9Q0W5G8_SALPP|nr:hypothetical protein OIU79_025811 [Salix purpurea]